MIVAQRPSHSEDMMLALLVCSFLISGAKTTTSAHAVLTQQVEPAPKSFVSPTDPYAALRLYDGKWDLIPIGAEKPAKTVHLENRCAKAGEFFACDQVVNGKNMALVVFLPMHALKNGGYAYRNQGLPTDQDGSGKWGNLEITGDRWVYSNEGTEKGKKIYGRTINIFSGSDKIHFEVQSSDDGVKWSTSMSGDEVRVK